MPMKPSVACRTALFSAVMLRDPVPPEKRSSLQLPLVPHCGRNKIFHDGLILMRSFRGKRFNI